MGQVGQILGEGHFMTLILLIVPRKLLHVFKEGAA